MSHAFIEEDVFVPAIRAKYSEPANLQWALIDLKHEGVENLDSIAADYGLDRNFLLGRFMRAEGVAHY